MAINFPTSLDVFTDPSASDQLNLPSHSGQHTDLNNAVEALEAKVGADSSAVTSSHDYKIAQLEAGATGGKILQVVSTIKTDTSSLSTGAASFSTVTGFTASITPSSTSNKVLVIGHIYGSCVGSFAWGTAITRGGTQIAAATGDAAGSRTRLTSFNYVAGSDTVGPNTFMFLDSPASTSALTYGLEVFNYSGITRTIYINRSINDTDSANFPRSISTLTVMEVAA